MKKLIFSTAFLCVFALSGKSQTQLNQGTPMREPTASKAAVNDDGTLKQAPAQAETQAPQAETKPAASPKTAESTAPKKEAATTPKKEQKANAPK